MTEQPLTISEVLRFANHDFLNHLHLIQMNLDLDRIEEAKAIIENISEHCKMLSNVNKLQLPLTVEWLQTFAWRFPAIQVVLRSHVDAAANSELDVDIVQYLENTIIHVYDHLDPYTEQQLHMAIETNVDELIITFHLQGKWQAPQFNKKVNHLTIQTIEETNESWKFVLNANKE